MKKLLALVLALVMTLGLATVATNASFKDESDVNLTEAVKVMSKVGVFQGNENGEFKPTANLDRASAAKLIAYLDLGEKAAEALPAVQVFSDVPASNWAAKYVAYCQNAGYIAGDGNGNFLPATELSGYAFGKMVLCVLGYDPTIEGFTGSNWSINVAKRLQSCGINDGIATAASATLTREQAAQYCLNALKATMVEYDDKGTTISAGDVTIQTGAKKANDKVVTSADTKWDAIDDAVADNTATKKIVQLGEKLYDGDLKRVDDTDDFGAPANTWSYKNETINTYFKAADASLKNRTTYGAIYSAIGKAPVESLISNGAVKAGTKSELKLYIDGVLVDTVSATSAPTALVLANFEKGNTTDFQDNAGTPNKFNGNGSVTNVYVKEDSANKGYYKITISVINTYIAKVSSVNAATSSKDRSINLTKKDSAAAVKAYETESFAKDDYVLYTASWKNTPGEVQTIKKVTPTDVVDVTSVKSDGDSFVGNGTTYKFTFKSNSTVSNGDSYQLYLDDAGYVAFADLYNDATTYSNYLVIVKDVADSGDGLGGIKYKANAITLDGVKLSGITLGKLDGKKITADSTSTATGVVKIARNTIYSFTKDSDGKYNLKAVADPYSSTDAVSVGTGTSGVTGFKFHAGATNVGGGISANNNTKFVVVDTNDDNKVYTYDGVSKMANIADANKAIASYLTKGSNVAKVVFVETNKEPENNASESKEIVYILSAKFDQTKDGDDTFETYSVINDGAKTTLTLKKNTSFTEASTDSANSITGAKAAVGLYWVKKYDGNKVEAIFASADAMPKDYTAYKEQNNATKTVTTTSGTETVPDYDKRAQFSDSVFNINGKSYLTDSKTAVYYIDKDQNVTTTTVDALENTNEKLDYYVVMKSADDVKTAVAIYIQENK